MKAIIRTLTILFAISFPLVSIAAQGANVQSPAELSHPSGIGRPSYDKAMSQLVDLMHMHSTTLNYEDSTDKFLIYKDSVSPQEIGETLYIRYSWEGPPPSKKYFGERASLKPQAAAPAPDPAPAPAPAKVAVPATPKAATPATAPPANLSNNNTYVNSSGNTVHSPANSTDGSIPTGATAHCNDGTYSFSQHHSGTCSSHGGVSQWLN